MHKLSLWSLIIIHTCIYASDKNYQEFLNISLTSIILPNSDYTVNLEYIEHFTEKPIKNCIQEAKENDMPLLLALCHNKNTSQIYNAFDLTVWCERSKNDPLTQEEITDIEFFKFEHFNEQMSIEHVGNLYNLYDQDSLLSLLLSYVQSQNIEQKNKMVLHISRFYNERAQDLPTAIRWCQKAAETGHIDAICELGYLFEQSGDLNQAFFCLKEAAERGDTLSAVNLGHLYAKNGDYQLALPWLKIGAQQGSPEAMRLLGNLYYRLGRTTKAIDWLTAGAMHNSPAAIADLASVYRRENELSIALDLYLKAAELNAPALDLFYMLHTVIGYPAHENSKKLQKYADMLVDKINQQDEYITSFKAVSPIRYQTAIDMVKRYATKQIVYSED